MFQLKSIRTRTALVLTALFLMVTPIANTTWAQTPDPASAPPEVTEVVTEVPTTPPTEVVVPPTEVVVPPTEVVVPAETVTETVPPTEVVTETMVPPVETVTETVPPVETETEVAPPPAETATDVATQPSETATDVVETPTEEAVAPTETESVDSDDSTPTAETEPSTPTPTEEVIVPDQLVVVGSSALSIGPDEVRDVTIRYTLGSDREKTELSVDLSAPGGESLEGWTIAPVNRGDTLEDLNDPNRTYKAGIDEAGAIQRENTFDVTWRLTAPAHIETPIALQLSFAAKIHREDGVTDGANMPNLVAANGLASVHSPSMNCDAAVGEDIANTWNCALDTTHPDDDVVINASAVVPAGWELKLDNAAMLANMSTPLDPAVVATGTFSLSAEYPIGCPDKTATSTATINLDLTYPSGEVSTLTQDLVLTFERPNSTLTVASFTFDDLDRVGTLSTTGDLTLDYADVPCSWQATIELSDLVSNDYTVTNASLGIVNTSGLDGGSVTISDGTITILAPDSTTQITTGTLTISLRLDFVHVVPPGSYVITLITHIALLDEL